MKILDSITPMEQNFSKWYQDVVVKGNLISYGPVKGSMIFKPIAYGIWENIQNNMNIILKKEGAQNVYLPLLIPFSYIEKEKEHIQGFAPELAMITKIGDKNLENSLVIRPTSEVVFGDFFSKQISSYNDLPLIYNQWANVVRWEKTTNPFLRNREFLWQEGHTVDATAFTARKRSRRIIKIYAKFMKKYLAMPVVIGKKTPLEKFAGAITTYTIEAMMKDGKALQVGTSHYFGQNFAKPFKIIFKNKDNKPEYGYQTSWGISTRLIGGIIMTHGDDRGIIIPPEIAPYQVDIIEIFGNKNTYVHDQAIAIAKILQRKYRIRLDDSNKSPGYKASQSEIEGTPLRIEIGPRDLGKGQVLLIRRDTLEKYYIKIQDVKYKVKELLKNIQNNLYLRAEDRLNNNFVEVDNYDDFKKLIKNKKFIITPFAGSKKDEKFIKDQTGATARCIPFNFKTRITKCILTGKKTRRFVIFARAY